MRPTLAAYLAISWVIEVDWPVVDWGVVDCVVVVGVEDTPTKSRIY
jgi:hypothetical protein